MSKPLILQPGLHEIAGSIASRVLEDIQKSKAGPNPAPEDESSRAAERPEVNTENSRVEANKLSAITNRKSSPVRGIENWDGKQTVVLRHEALTSCQKDLFQKFKEARVRANELKTALAELPTDAPEKKQVQRELNLASYQADFYKKAFKQNLGIEEVCRWGLDKELDARGQGDSSEKKQSTPIKQGGDGAEISTNPNKEKAEVEGDSMEMCLLPQATESPPVPEGNEVAKAETFLGDLAERIAKVLDQQAANKAV